MTDFQVGDRVKVKEDSPTYWAGKEGVITFIDGIGGTPAVIFPEWDDWPIEVKFDSGQNLTAYATFGPIELEKIQ